MQLLDLRSAALLILCAALSLGLAACGAGETTVTVTETVAAKPQQGGGEKQEKPDVGSGENGAVTGYVDNVAVNGSSLVLSGWAGSSDLSEPAAQVSASVGGKNLAQVVPTLKREDVVEVLGEPGLAESGFELSLPLAALECDAPSAGIEVTGYLDGEESALLFGEGVKGRIAAEC